MTVSMKTSEEIEVFEKLETQVHSIRRELNELSKKKPNDALNKFKLGHLNKLLSKCNEFLSPDIVLDDFIVFDENMMPTNSDCVFVLSHYSDALHRFRKFNTRSEGSGRFAWIVKDSKQTVAAPNPEYKRYSEKG